MKKEQYTRKLDRRIARLEATESIAKCKWRAKSLRSWQGSFIFYATLHKDLIDLRYGVSSFIKEQDMCNIQKYIALPNEHGNDGDSCFGMEPLDTYYQESINNLF